MKKNGPFLGYQSKGDASVSFFRLSRLGFSVAVLSLFLAIGAFTVPSVASAQTPQESANTLARAVSQLLTKDKAQVPSVGAGSSKEFKYESADPKMTLSCTRRVSNIDRAGTFTDTTFCSSSTSALKTTCSDPSGSGLRYSCSITDAGGAVIKIDGENTFSPNRVGEDAVIDKDGDQVGETTGKPIEEASQGGSENTCNFGHIDVCIRNLPGMIISVIALLMLMLAGAILAIAGTVFNWVVIRTVYQFGAYFGSSDGMLTAWGVLRDIANIGLLFGFIFMGVLLILNVDGGGHGHGGGISAKKAIPRLIIFAVLLNFSLFASQAVIDVSNAFSSTFATLAGEQNCSSAADGSGGTMSDEACANLGISGKIMEVTGMSGLWKQNFSSTGDTIASGFTNIVNQPYSYSIMLICLTIFVLVTAMVLFAGAIMLIIRVIVLSLLMVTSPIGFAGLAIPKLQGIAGMWWSKLMSQSFFAPVYLLLIFISLKLSDGLMDGKAGLGEALMGNQGSAAAGNLQVVMVFMIVIGFMIASLIAASKMGAMGAKFATSTAAGMTVGAVGFVGRRTIGRASARIGENIRKSPLGHTELGRVFAGVADKGASASYSLRNGMGGLSKVGLDVGKAGGAASGGWEGIVHKGTEEREKYAKSLQQTDADKAAEKRLKGEKEGLETTKKQKEKEWGVEKQRLQDNITDEEAANKVKKEEIEQKRKIQETKMAAALARGNEPGAAEAAAEAEAEITKLNQDALTLAKDTAASSTAKRTAVREKEKAHKEELERIDQNMKAIDTAIKGDKDKGIIGVGSDAAGNRYAADLRRTQDSLLNKITAGHDASHHAADSIVKKAGRSKVEQAIHDLKGETQKTDHEKATDSHTPVDAPAASHSH